MSQFKPAGTIGMFPRNAAHKLHSGFTSFIRQGELVNGITHVAGFIAAIPGMLILINNAPANARPIDYFSLYVFGFSLLLLYAASSIYHLLNISEKCTLILRRMDHMMIFVLIAGTYTPICLIGLKGIWGWALFASIWGLALTGMGLKIFFFNAPRWLSTLFYLIMGWMVVVAFYPLLQVISWDGCLWLVLGGISYTVGAVIYALKRPNIALKYLGFHEIFHLFVLTGSICHYWLIFKYILPL